MIARTARLVRVAVVVARVHPASPSRCILFQNKGILHLDDLKGALGENLGPILLIDFRNTEGVITSQSSIMIDAQVCRGHEIELLLWLWMISIITLLLMVSFLGRLLRLGFG